MRPRATPTNRLTDPARRVFEEMTGPLDGTWPRIRRAVPTRLWKALGALGMATSVAGLSADTVAVPFSGFVVALIGVSAVSDGSLVTRAVERIRRSPERPPSSS